MGCGTCCSVQPTTSRTAEIRHRAARRDVEELLIVMRGQIRDRLQRNTGASHLNQDTNVTRCKSVSAGAASVHLSDSKLFAERISGESGEKISSDPEIKQPGNVNKNPGFSQMKIPCNLGLVRAVPTRHACRNDCGGACVIQYFAEFLSHPRRPAVWESGATSISHGYPP